MHKGQFHICFLVHSLPIGGMERVVSQLANYLSAKDGVKIDLVLYGRDCNVDYEIMPAVSIIKPDFTFNEKQRRLSAIKRGIYLRRAVKRIAPDCVVSFGEYWNSFALLFLMGLPFPVFLSDRSSPDKKIGFIQDILRSRLYRRARGVIAQTKKAKEIAEANKRNNNIRVIGNPIRQIDTAPFVSRENIVLMVGRLIQTKHIDRLIRLFVKIDTPGWKLVIVGGDAQKQTLMSSLRQLVAELNAKKGRVILAGPQKDVDSYYRRSKIFAFTSSSEGFPNVVGEALSAGLPVVSYDCVAGPSEMIRDGENGFLAPVFDDELFAERLRRLMDDDALRMRMSEKARESMAGFSIDVIGEQYYEFITAL